MPLYRLFGFDVATELPIAGLVESPSGAPCPRVTVRFGELPRDDSERVPHRVQISDANRQIARFGSGCCTRFRYPDGTEFAIDDDGAQVWAAWPRELTFEDTVTSYLIGPVLGYLARLRFGLVLHASGIVVDGRVLALMGPAGAGKSTTAAALVARGMPLITEDVMVLAQHAGAVVVQPGYARIKLWDPSVTALFGSSDALPRIVPGHPTWKKKFLEVSAARETFHGQTAPLSAIYYLGERSRGSGPLLSAILPREALSLLVANSYGDVLISKTQRAQEFALWSEIARKTLLRRVVARPDLADLDALCDAIVSDFRANEM